MKTRLEKFIEAEDKTQASFADSINVARASVSHILAGRNKPGYDFICNLMSRYPRLNIEWLLTGKGKMYKDSPEDPSPVQQVAPAAIPDQSLPTAKQHTDQPSQEVDSPSIFDVLEDNISDRQAEPEENMKTTNGINTSDTTLQNIVKQRKATRIIIFYDDDTFQEFR